MQETPDDDNGNLGPIDWKDKAVATALPNAAYQSALRNYIF